MLAAYRENEEERERQKNQEREAVFTNCHLSYIPLISFVLICNSYCSQNIISCLKREVKNNISHRNLDLGEHCLTGMADYWCIFNRVKDLQWCMWLPFQSRRPCHLFQPATSRDDSNGEVSDRTRDSKGNILIVFLHPQVILTAFKLKSWSFP